MGAVTICSLVVACVQFVMSNGREQSLSADENQTVLRSKRVLSRGGKAGRLERRIVERAVARPSAAEPQKEMAKAEVVRGEEDVALDQLVEGVIAQLQDAVEKRDFKRLQSLVASLSSGGHSPFGSRGVPVAVRKALVSALASFGVGALPELVSFIGDEDPAVAQLAVSTFEHSVGDFSLSDYERAPLIVAAAKVMTGGEDLIGLMQNMTILRNSLKCEVFGEILETGTPAAQQAAKDKMSFLFNESIETAEDAAAYYETHPDGPNDNKIFGGNGKRNADVPQTAKAEKRAESKDARNAW